MKSLIVDALEGTPPEESVIVLDLHSLTFQTEAWKIIVHITPIPLTTYEAICNVAMRMMKGPDPRTRVRL